MQILLLTHESTVMVFITYIILYNLSVLNSETLSCGVFKMISCFQRSRKSFYFICFDVFAVFEFPLNYKLINDANPSLELPLDGENF